MQIVFGKSMLVITPFLLHIDLSQINEELFFVVLVEAVTDFAVFFIVVDPMALAEVVVALLNFLHVVSNFCDHCCLALKLFGAKERHFRCD